MNCCLTFLRYSNRAIFTASRVCGQLSIAKCPRVITQIAVNDADDDDDDDDDVNVD